MKTRATKTRREFLASATAASLALSSKLYAIGHLPMQTPGAPGAPTIRGMVTVSKKRTIAVPRNFVGLSYETQQLADPTFFSPKNKQLIAQFKALSPCGVLRLGGNTSDFSWWKPTPTSTAPEWHDHHPAMVGEPAADFSYAVEPIAVDNLRRFLDATNWTCLYGINLGRNTPESAADQAAYAAKALGPRLEYFQLGNEADLFGRHIRDEKTWTADAFFAEWLAMARAVVARVPDAKFGGPDVANHLDWLTAFADNLAKTPDAPKVVTLSHHHYVGGPPSSETMTIPNILAGPAFDKEVDKAIGISTTAAEKIHARVRMTEGNTCYRGGKPGVSDVFAASLWSADYLLHLASAGYAGVNLHGGDAKAVANSLGGTLPGEALMKNPKEPHPKPFYTPIANIDGIYTAEPVFYGMLFAQQFAGATLLEVTLDAAMPAAPGQKPAQINATAYAAVRPDGKTIIAIINKDLTTDILLHITGAYLSSSLPLSAPAPNSHDVTFARARVGIWGTWNAQPDSETVVLGHNAPVRIPCASAMLLVSR